MATITAAAVVAVMTMITTMIATTTAMTAAMTTDTDAGERVGGASPPAASSPRPDSPARAAKIVTVGASSTAMLAMMAGFAIADRPAPQLAADSVPVPVVATPVLATPVLATPSSTTAPALFPGRRRRLGPIGDPCARASTRHRQHRRRTVAIAAAVPTTPGTPAGAQHRQLSVIARRFSAMSCTGSVIASSIAGCRRATRPRRGADRRAGTALEPVPRRQ